MSSGNQERLTDIFEAANMDMREIYVGCGLAGAQPMEMKKSLSERLPAWRPEHKISFRIVRTQLPIVESETFIADHVRSIARVGWSVIAD